MKEEAKHDDRVIQMFINERFDIFAVLESGRVYKKRAVGHSGNYGSWVEQDIMGEIKKDVARKTLSK